MKTKITVMAAIPALMLAVAGYAQESSPNAEAKPGAKGAIEVGAITATSKVTGVDPAKRTVTLTNEAGETTYQLGKNVRNFDQIKVGDEVKATVLQSVAVTVRKSSAPPDASGRGLIAVAPKGAMPGVIMAKTRQISAKIASVDTQARTVTVEGPAGGTPTIKVGPNVNLDELQKGDDVTLRVTDALAIRVEKP
jgi:Cu/Ag efflux protein CusF